MPVLRDWQIDINVDMILRHQGADPVMLRQRSPLSVATAERALKEGLPLLAPVALYRRLSLISVTHERICLEHGGSLGGALPARQLSSAQEVVVIVCTIGKLLEQAVSREMSLDPALALALDSLGSLAVHTLTASLCTHFTDLAAMEGLRVSMPISPGLAGWPVEQGQKQIFSLVDAAEVGVTLTSSFQMIPRKSASLVIGMGVGITDSGRPCDYCNLRTTCRYQEHYA
ncbi:MAG: hypothetical protein HY326_01720 [Chloroflexi bacterium]|nr:hypothetical protein [Chloroflexota bacterium]